MIMNEVKQIADNWEGHLTYLRMIDEELWALTRFIFTCAIIGDIDMWGYRTRYCYHTEADALAAFEAWDGSGEPAGWHRALIQGEPVRKTDADGKIYVEGRH